jgi:hypothetical protein
MHVRLTAKLAEVVNGIDLKPYAEGDIIDLPERDARLLIAEKWAVIVDEPYVLPRPVSRRDDRAIAADAGRRRKRSASSHRSTASTDGLV